MPGVPGPAVAQIRTLCYIDTMIRYIHARVGKEERGVLEDLKRSTGRTESEIIRRGLQLVAEEEGRRRNALELAGRSVGRFKNGPHDLSTNARQMEGFGE